LKTGCKRNPAIQVLFFELKNVNRDGLNP